MLIRRTSRSQVCIAVGARAGPLAMHVRRCLTVYSYRTMRLLYTTAFRPMAGLTAICPGWDNPTRGIVPGGNVPCGTFPAGNCPGRDIPCREFPGRDNSAKLSRAGMSLPAHSRPGMYRAGQSRARLSRAGLFRGNVPPLLRVASRNLS